MSAPIRRLILVAVVAAAGLPAFAHADSLTRAKQLYDAGLTDYNLGHYESALSSFEQAYRVRHDPALLFNIGQCQRQLHRYEDAARSYRAYLRESPDVSPAAREQVQKLIGEMDAAVAEHRATQPPTGTRAPTEPPTPQQPEATRLPSTPAPTPSQPALTPSASVAATPAPRPLYKRAWLWATMAAVVAVGIGVGVGVGVAETTPNNAPHPADALSIHFQ